jgi:glycerophosphoryl diester phosphodiesterase
MWIDLPHPIIIAHRGDKAHAPENTLPAFNLAVEKGADAIEFDVKLTSDGQVIVHHDRLVDRTTDGTGKISKYSFTSLRDLDAGSWFSDGYSGERIPTMDEVFETVGKRTHIDVELTNYTTPLDDLVTCVVEKVKRHGLQDRMLFSSFFPRNLRKAHLLLPEVPLGLLTMRDWKGFWGRTFGWRGDYYAFHPHFTNANAGLVDRVHAMGKRVQVWTVNAEEDLKRMIGLGVDGIFTDDPELALRLLGRSQ